MWIVWLWTRLIHISHISPGLSEFVNSPSGVYRDVWACFSEHSSVELVSTALKEHVNLYSNACQTTWHGNKPQQLMSSYFSLFSLLFNVLICFSGCLSYCSVTSRQCVYFESALINIILVLNMTVSLWMERFLHSSSSRAYKPLRHVLSAFRANCLVLE